MPTATASPLPISETVEPVSQSNPGVAASSALQTCQIGGSDDRTPVTLAMVVGMGQLQSARDILRFVALTGREPVFASSGPVWVVQVKGDVPQRGGEVWSDPTCIVSANVSGWYATGPIRNVNTGKTTLPESPTRPPDQALPPLAP
jgi:hypothetical protein